MLRFCLLYLPQLCLPCPGWVSPEYGCLFPADAPDSSSKDGKLALLSRFKQQLGEWGNLLRRFLRSEDDQVRCRLQQLQGGCCLNCCPVCLACWLCEG